MPSFSDSILIFIIALLLFGPKKLPVLARELGKWIGEFRRASNEFKMQMEDELRQSEQADRQKQIVAMEAAAPVTPPLADPEHPHTDAEIVPAEEITPLPIASSGDLDIMPPATGLPTPRSGGSNSAPLGSLLESIPVAETEAEPTSELQEALRESALHGD